MERVLEQKTNIKRNGGLSRRMAQFLVEDSSVLLHHGEILWKDGKPITDVRSASYGHSLKGAVGLTMIEARGEAVVNKDYITTGDWQVEIADKKYPCRLSFAPLYDPKSLKIKI